MNDKNTDLTQVTSRTFSLENSVAPIIFLLIMLSVTLFLTFLEVKNRENSGAFYFFLGFLFLLFILVISIPNLADVFICEDGISRIAFGKTWQVIRWNNVKLIKLFNSFDQANRKTIRAFNIYPAIKPKFRLLASGKMMLSEKVDRPREFIELLNKYIVKYNIKIESTVAGVKTSLTQL